MRNLIVTAAVMALTSGAMAQTTTPPTIKPTMPPAAKSSVIKSTPAPAASPAPATPGRKPATAQSKACSSQADAKGLHGKDREKFRRACLKGA